MYVLPVAASHSDRAPAGAVGHRPLGLVSRHRTAATRDFGGSTAFVGGVQMQAGGAPQLIRVVGAVVLKDGLVFMAQRPMHKERGGLWEFPGGKVDPGETDQEALARELQEELHVRCTVLDDI